MENLLYNYTFLKALFDKGQEYIDCFWPIAIRLFPEKESVDTNFIQNRMKSELAIDIPIHVIDSIVKRMKRHGYIDQLKGVRKYELSSRGFAYQKKLEKEKEVKSRIDKLLSGLIEYFATKDITLSEKEALDLMVSFVNKNRKSVIRFLNPSIVSDNLVLEKKDANSNILINFMQTLVADNETDQYNTLRDLILGSIISTTIYSRDASEFEKIGKKKFKDCKIYLDTNLVFSILELHEPELNKAALELLKLLKEFRFDIRILHSTISEICNVVKGYRRQYYKYPRNLKIDTIFSTLRRKGWGKSDVHEFIIDLESELKKKGVLVELSINIDLSTYKPKEQELFVKLDRYKPGQHILGKYHDMSAIESIRDIRGKKIRAIEECKAAFLSSDIRLSQYNFIEMGHHSEGTICEVFLDRLFTNILWLKNPKLNLPLEAIISIHSRDLFINWQVWDRFYDVLQELHKSGRVDEGRISTLFYHNYIERILQVIDEADIDKITPSFVLEHIQEQSKYIDQKHEVDKSVLQEKLIGEFESDKRKMEVEKEEEFFKKMKKIKSNISSLAKRKASRYLIGIRVIFALVLGIILLIVYCTFNTDSLTQLSMFISYILIILGMAFPPKEIFFKWLHRKLELRIYYKLLNQIGIVDD